MPTTDHRPPTGLEDSPLYWLAVLRSARVSADSLLERVARKRLTALGVRVIFDDAPPEKADGQGGR